VADEALGPSLLQEMLDAVAAEDAATAMPEGFSFVNLLKGALTDPATGQVLVDWGDFDLSSPLWEPGCPRRWCQMV
jgi:hypothetical protein